LGGSIFSCTTSETVNSMASPIPKPAALRQRRNKTTTVAHLPSEAETEGRKAPPLHKREDGEKWHPRVLEWWRSIWRSPMSGEFLDADMRGGLYLLADLHQLRWVATSRTALIEAAKEIRLQEVRFGLSPIDRRRLQWEVARGEEAERKTTSRKKATPAPADDPRAALKVVS